MVFTAMVFGFSVTPRGVEVVPQAYAQQDASAALDAISSDLSRLESGSLDAELVRTKFSAEERLSDARVAYELGQYDRSSYLFLDVISRTSADSFAGYRQALYMLADSLYQNRNYIGARNYLKELKALGPGEYYQEGLAKLLEISYATNNYTGVEELYSALGSSQKPGIAYLRGKALYEQKRYVDAQQAFQQSAADEEFAYKGTYYAGVSLVEQGKFDEAITKFKSLASRVPERIDDEHIYNLAHLALGRIAYEQERYAEALNHYTSVDRRDDDAFISAMYESAWANIQLEKYQQAEQMLDILISAEPSVDTYTQAMLLKADLAQRSENYDSALQTYEILLSQYNPVRDQLFAFAGQHPELKTFFRGLVQDDLSIRIPEGLPNVRTDFEVMPPSEWLVEDEQLTRTRELIEDVGITRANLQSAYEDLRQIEARLNSGSRLKSFPKLASSMGKLTSIESRLIDVQANLVAKQAEYISPGLSGADAESWKEMKAELAVLRERYMDIPRDVNELKDREKKVDADFKRLQERILEVSYALDGVRSELTEIEIYMQTQDLMLSQEEKARVEKLRVELQDAMTALAKEEQSLRAEIKVARENASGGDTLADEERKLRFKYQQKLAAAADFLSRRKGSASSPSSVASLERAQAKVGPISSRVQGFYKKMDTVVVDRSSDVVKTVENLKIALGQERAALEETAATSRVVAGDLAYRTFLDRAYQFDQIVLRADVGKIDVLFTQKEGTTDKINDLYQKRTDELRELQEAFDELR